MGPVQSCRASWMDSLFRKLFFLIPFGVMGNVFYALLATKGSLYGSVPHFSPGYILIALLLSFAPWFTGSLRLLLWSRFLGKLFRYRDVFRIVLGAELGAAISPPVIGGTAVKTVMLMQRGLSGGTALSIAMLEGLEDGLLFLIMVPLALTLSSSWDLPVIQGLLSGIRHLSPRMFLTGTGIACGAFLVMGHPRCRTFIMRSHPAARLAARLGQAFRSGILIWRTVRVQGKAVFAATFVLTAVSWICRYSVFSLLIAAFGLPARRVLFTALQVLVFASMSFIPTPGGAGGAEAVFYLFYRPFLTADTIGAVTMGWRFLTFYVLLIVAAVIFLLMQDGKVDAGIPAHDFGVPTNADEDDGHTGLLIMEGTKRTQPRREACRQEAGVVPVHSKGDDHEISSG